MQRLGRFLVRRRWFVIVAWILLALLLGSLRNTYGGTPRDSFSVPGTDSQAATDLFSERFPDLNLPTAILLFESGAAFTSNDQVVIEASLTKLRALPRVDSVSDPFGTPPSVSAKGNVAAVTVTYSVPASDLSDRKNTFSQLEEAIQPARNGGVRVYFGGAVTDLFNEKVSGASAHADEIGLAFAIVILLIAFGSVVAAGLPLFTSLSGLTAGISIIYLLANQFTIGTVVPYLGTMIGLGVGIDYALFIVTRFRQNLANGMEVPEAIEQTLSTAGTAVLFAGGTVSISSLGLILVGIPYVSTLAIACALVVAIMMAAALTLLPAILAILGKKVDRWHLPHLPSHDRPLAARWANEVARRPWWFAIGAAVILITFALPVFKMDLAFTTDGDEPLSTPQRQEYDAAAAAFGQGFNAPLLVVIELPNEFSTRDTTDATEGIEKLLAAVQKTPGVEAVSPPLPDKDFNAVVISVIPKYGPSDPRTASLVDHLHNNVLPEALKGVGIKDNAVHVGGSTAILVDLTDRISARLPVFILAVVGAAFLLLIVAFRSIVMAAKAAIMNLLSIGAAYGVVVAIFQWGWLRELVGLDETVPIVPIVPVMMFAILFGLSMDYEVFLLSRIREQWLVNHDSKQAVVEGLTLTARVITSAALIMIAVFGSFVTNPQPIVKMMGVGLASAVLIDATVVRMILVPATMVLLGRLNWYIPRWLDRILPHVSVD